MKYVFALLFIVSVSNIANAAEPASCDPNTFMRYQLPTSEVGLKNARVFKIGQLTLAGLGVGDSDSRYVEHLALSYSRANSGNKFCTWYFNKGNEMAEANFNHAYVPQPTSSNSNAVVKKYDEVLRTYFSSARGSFTSCATEQQYLAMGCNGMRHRGPSVFAMVLSFAGCSAQNSVAIVNKIWGENGIPTENRLALAQHAIEIAKLEPAASAELKRLMSSK